jgi:carnitine O-acetyltransferase
MLQYQANLPKLPVPALDRTLSLYLASVRPLLSDTDYQKTAAAAQDFLTPGGLGEALQQRLVARSQETVNWMEEWWLDQAYMGYRDSVVLNVSYFFAYKDDKTRKDPAHRAAAITTAALAFKQEIVR